MSEVAIPRMLMRGGTWKGPLLLASDLPLDPQRSKADMSQRQSSMPNARWSGQSNACGEKPLHEWVQARAYNATIVRRLRVRERISFLDPAGVELLPDFATTARSMS